MSKHAKEPADEQAAHDRAALEFENETGYGIVWGEMFGQADTSDVRTYSAFEIGFAKGWRAAHE